MSDVPPARNLEAVLAQMEQAWRELMEMLKSEPSAPGKVVTAEKFVLVDPKGEPRGKLEVKEDGSAVLALQDGRGNYRAWLGLKEDGSGFLTLKDRLGRISHEAPPAADQSPGARPPGLEAAKNEASSSPDSPVLERLERLGTDLAGLRQLVKDQGRSGEGGAAPASEPPPARPEEAAAAEPPGQGNQPGRLEKLEQGHRRLKAWGGVAAVVLLGALIALGALWFRLPETRGPVTTSALTIHDTDGACRAWLGPRDGGVHLDLMDPAGKVRTTLSLDPEGAPSLKLLDRDQKIRAELALNPRGEPGLNLLDQAGLLRVALGHVEGNHPAPAELLERPTSSLVLINQDGVPVWRAPLRWRR